MRDGALILISGDVQSDQVRHRAARRLAVLVDFGKPRTSVKKAALRFKASMQVRVNFKSSVSTSDWLRVLVQSPVISN